MMAHYPSEVQRPSFLQAMSCQPTEGDDDEFILASVELEEILADRHMAPKAAKGVVSHLPVIITKDAGFELSSWV